jgi:periplasmic protein TonB
VLTALRELRSRQALRRAALVSCALHAGVLALLLIGARLARRDMHEAVDATPTVELVMLEQKGAGPSEAQAPPAAVQPEKPVPVTPPAVTPPVPPPVPPAPQPPAAQPPAAQPPAASTAPTPPAPPPPKLADDAAAVKLPPPPPPAPPPPAAATPPAAAPPAPPPITAPPTPPQMAAREATPPLPNPARPPVPASPTPPEPEADSTPRVNLGGTDSLSNVLVQGDQVIPAAMDAKVHNREPIYPDDAVRRGEQGAVVLLIRVSPEGLASSVDIARSSGFNLLDRAARDAVATWRFLPAVRDGQPIASSMSVRVVFQLD